MTEIGREQHYFGLVPVVVYINNEECSGDFEKVISLIDAYDLMESESLNNQQYFSDAYLTITGMTLDEDTVGNMKENRVMLLDEGCSAEWLIKQENDALVENIKNRLDNDIHKFSKVPNMSDKEFSSNSSGVAIKYKTMALENLAAIKERKFKKGLQRRIELIFNTLGLKGDKMDWRAIDIAFKRNLPTNETEIANMVNQLRGLVSEETLVAQIPFVDNVMSEVEKLQAEKEKNM
jgi:SPP1 family phage portal protein